MYIVLAGLIIGLAALTNSFDDVKKYSDTNWKEELQKENQELLEENSEVEDEDDFIIEMNSEIIAKNNYYLENNIKPNYSGWHFALDTADMLSIVSLLTIIVAAGIVANEFRWGTIKLLLIRPISRTRILLSKYVSVLLFALVTSIFMFLFSWIVGVIFFGIGEANPHMVVEQNGGFANISIIKEIVSTYGYGMVNLVMMATFAFMISVAFRNSSLAIGLAIFLMMAGNSIVGFFMEREWVKYLLFANTNLKQYADGAPLIEGMTLSFSVTVLIVYYLIFMILSWLVFTKRDVAGQ